MFDFFHDLVTGSASISITLVEVGMFALILYAWLCLSWFIENWMSGTRKGRIKLFHKWFWIGIGIIAAGAVAIMVFASFLYLFTLIALFILIAKVFIRFTRSVKG